jgi:hypothetical protein
VSDCNRDYLKENRDALDRSLEWVRMPWELDDKKQKSAREAKEKIENAIEKTRMRRSVSERRTRKRGEKRARKDR